MGLSAIAFEKIPHPANEDRTEGTELQTTSAEMHRGIAKGYEVYKYTSKAFASRV